MIISERFVSKCCIGERCSCSQFAAAKIGEEVQVDDPRWGSGIYHELTSYVCAKCFDLIFSPSKIQGQDYYISIQATLSELAQHPHRADYLT